MRDIITEQSDDGVLVNVQRAGDGAVATYRARYLVGANGGKIVGPKIGVELEGPASIVKFASAYVKADMSQYCDGTCLLASLLMCVCVCLILHRWGLDHALCKCRERRRIQPWHDDQNGPQLGPAL